MHESDLVQVLDAQPQCRRSPGSTSGWRRAGNDHLTLKLRAVKVPVELAAIYVCVCVCIVLVSCASRWILIPRWHHSERSGDILQGENTLQLGCFISGYKLGELGGKAVEIENCANKRKQHGAHLTSVMAECTQ